MNKAFLPVLLLWAGPVFAQGVDLNAVSYKPEESVSLSLQEAEQRALDRNPAIAQARLGSQAASLTIAEGRAAYSPIFSASLAQRSQTNPSTTQLSGGQQQVTTDAATYSSGISQALPWGGGSLSVDFTGNRTATSNAFSTFNPSLTSGVTAALTQPLLRGFRFDSTRAAIEQAQVGSDIADVELRQEMAVTLADVRRAYWELVYATDARTTALQSEALAQRQLEDSRVRVELGTVAPIDLVESEAEVASRHQAVVQADGAWRTAQVALKQLVVADAGDPIWSAEVVPVDRPGTSTRVIDLQTAIAAAVTNRSDVQIARKERQGTATTVRLLDNLRKPAVDFVAQYSVNGLGGTQILHETGTLGTARRSSTSISRSRLPSRSDPQGSSTWSRVPITSGGGRASSRRRRHGDRRRARRDADHGVAVPASLQPARRQLVTIDVLRGDTTARAQVKAVLPAHVCERLPALMDTRDNVVDTLGIMAMALDEPAAQSLAVRRGAGVIVVARVDTRDAADVALTKGDVIHAVNGTPVATPANLRATLTAIERGGAVVLQVERAGQLTYVAFEQP